MRSGARFGQIACLALAAALVVMAGTVTAAPGKLKVVHTDPEKVPASTVVNQDLSIERMTVTINDKTNFRYIAHDSASRPDIGEVDIEGRSASEKKQINGQLKAFKRSTEGIWIKAKGLASEKEKTFSNPYTIRFADAAEDLDGNKLDLELRCTSYTLIAKPWWPGNVYTKANLSRAEAAGIESWCHVMYVTRHNGKPGSKLTNHGREFEFEQLNTQRYGNGSAYISHQFQYFLNGESCAWLQGGEVSYEVRYLNKDGSTYQQAYNFYTDDIDQPNFFPDEDASDGAWSCGRFQEGVRFSGGLVNDTVYVIDDGTGEWKCQVSGNAVYGKNGSTKNDWDSFSMNSGIVYQVKGTLSLTISGSGCGNTAFTPYNALGGLRVEKQSANPAISKGNSCYSLAGARFSLFEDGDCSHPARGVNGQQVELESDGNGEARTGVILRPGTYYLKETHAPKGYKLDGSIHKVDIKANNFATIAIKERPCGITDTNLATKVDKDGAAGAQGDATLAGAQFSLRYWDNTEGKTDEAPLRTWVIKSGADGSLRYEKSSLVSGDELFEDESGTILPLGSYTLQETRAPAGYELSDTSVKTFVISQNNNGSVQRHTEGPDNGGAQSICVYDKVRRGKISGTKADAWLGGSAQGDAELGGAEIEVINSSNAAVIIDGHSFASGEVVTRCTTRPDGSWTTDENLPYGTYSLRETKAPVGYKPNDSWQPRVTLHPTGSQETVCASAETLQEEALRGGIHGTKHDRERGSSHPQGDATLAGAIIEVVNAGSRPVVVNGQSIKKDQVATRCITAENGSWTTDSKELPYGTYLVRESAAPRGYLVDEQWSEIITVHPQAEGDVSEATSCPAEPIVRGGVRACKLDGESGQAKALGQASLAGAELVVINRSKESVLVDGTEYAPGEIVATLQTNEGGVAESSKSLLPYGTYEIHEGKAPKGYLINKSWSKCFSIGYEADGTDAFSSKHKDMADLSQEVSQKEKAGQEDETDGAQGMKHTEVMQSSSSALAEQIIREDFRFSKKEAGSMRPLANIPFLIVASSDADGDGVHESHVIVTDENGTFDTSNFDQDKRDNANDIAVSGAVVKVEKHGSLSVDTSGVKIDEEALDSESGVWFSGRTDLSTRQLKEHAAFVYDRYLVCELPCKANEGHQLLHFEVSMMPSERNMDRVVDLGTVEDGKAACPKLKKSSEPREGSVVAPGDTITYHLALTNDGDEDAQDWAVFDELPAHTSYVEGSANHDGAYGKNGIGWKIKRLASGKTITLTFSVKVDSDTPSKTKIDNFALAGSAKEHPRVASELGGKIIQSNQTTHVVLGKAGEHGNLVSSYKSADPPANSKVKADDTITYTITTTNTATTTAPYVLVRDYLPEGVSYKDGSLTTEGAYVEASKSKDGRAYLEWVLPNLAARETRTVSFTVVVCKEAPPVIENTAYTATQNHEIVAGDPKNEAPKDETNLVRHITDKVVDLPPVIRVTKTSNPEAGTIVAAGSTISYSLHVENLGTCDATGIGVYDPIDEHLRYVEGSADHGGRFSEEGVGWHLERLGAGKTVTLGFKVKVDPEAADATLVRNQASWDTCSDIPQGWLEKNSTNVVEHAVGSVRVNKQATSKQVVAGESLTYTIEVTNTTSQDIAGYVLKDIPGEGLAYEHDDSQGRLQDDGSAAWTIDVAAGATRKIQVVCQASKDAKNLVINTAMLLDETGAEIDRDSAKTTVIHQKDPEPPEASNGPESPSSSSGSLPQTGSGMMPVACIAVGLAVGSIGIGLWRHQSTHHKRVFGGRRRRPRHP